MKLKLEQDESTLGKRKIEEDSLHSDKKPKMMVPRKLSMYGIIWDEIGEGYNERDKMLLELEQECTTRKLRKLASTYLSCKDP
ncbi:hypothetical protein Bca4012_081769 [Brassica carinata]|uniref:Uncharacterized protein n=1 Tax=Brassica carinata TaxID=52824 RepID=A0A8X8AR29_BRACI|nr:hypothetical protein Bca52824_029040 [Brassica carinata]